MSTESVVCLCDELLLSVSIRDLHYNALILNEKSNVSHKANVLCMEYIAENFVLNRQTWTLQI